MTSKPGIPSPVIDVELLARALQTAWPTHQEGSGGTGAVEHRTWEVIDSAYPSDALAQRIAAEYTRLASESSIPVEEGDR